MKEAYKTAVVGAIVGAFVSVALTALVGLLVGKKADEGQQHGPIRDVITGSTIIFNMALSKKSLSESIPQDAPRPAGGVLEPAAQAPAISAQPSKAIAGPGSSADIAPTPEAISTSPQVLDSCFGVTPLKLMRVRVEANRDGYSVSLRARNEGKTSVSVWSDGQPQLNDDAKNNFLGGGVTLPTTGYYTFIHADQQGLGQAYVGGKVISQNDQGAIGMQFSRKGDFSAGRTVSLQLNLAYVLKDEAGHFELQRQTLSCQAVPVLASDR